MAQGNRSVSSISAMAAGDVRSCIENAVKIVLAGRLLVGGVVRVRQGGGATKNIKKKQ